MTDDSTLLRRFASDRSEEAFAELVRRHLNLVYSAAVRTTGGDRQLAEDASQTVFTALARNARALTRHPILTGWLYTTAHFTAAKMVRTERRRRVREQEAQAMQELRSSPTPATDWVLRGILRPSYRNADTGLLPESRSGLGPLASEVADVEWPVEGCRLPRPSICRWLA